VGDGYRIWPWNDGLFNELRGSNGSK